MITEDGRLRYQVELPPRRGWRHQLRHVVNPVTGITCGLVLGAALFVLAVQGLLGVRASVVAVLIAVAAVVVYLVGLLRARMAAYARPTYGVDIDEAGVRIDTDGRDVVRVAWARFMRWLETEHDFVLVTAGLRDRLVVVLPKDGIDESEQDLLREVFHSRIDPDDEPIEDAFVEMDWDAEPARRVAD